MIYSSACGYAIQTITRLTLMQSDGYVLLDDLCAGTDLPRHFVAKVFQDLVREGLLVSAKGRGGGFALAREPKQITLLQIVAAIDGLDHFDECVVGMAKCSDLQPCPQHDEWKTIRTRIRSFLEATTLDKMGKTTAKKMHLIGMTLPSPTRKSKPL